MAAPICSIAPPKPTFDSVAPQLPSIPLVSINAQNWDIPQPVISDIQQIVESVNTMRQVLVTLTNSGPKGNNFGGGLIGGGGGGAGGLQGGGVRRPRPPQNKQQKQQKKQGAGFREIDRVTKIIKVVNPDDKDQYVKVKQIVSLTFRDPVSGLTWTWKQGPDINQNAP